MFKRKLPFKTVFFLLICLTVFSLVKDFPETNAFLKDTDINQALTAVGELKVSLVDDTVVGNLTVGSNHSRDIYVENQGNGAMFIRVMVHPTLENTVGNQRILQKNMMFPVLTSQWIDGHDGYYYYQKKLLKKTTTEEPIFSSFMTTGVEVTEKLTFHFKVEAVTTKGLTYRDAWWEGTQPSSTNRGSLVFLDSMLKTLAD